MSDSHDNFFQTYLSYIGETEAPMFYHRWSALSMVGAFLGREFYFRFGHSNIYPNMYTMLIGEPGTRKSTAIKLAKKIIASAGYKNISSEKTSKEKFLLDLAEQNGIEDVDALLDSAYGWGSDSRNYSEMFIACDEFNDFIGLGNLEFISLLGNLWDFSGPYENRNKTTKSIKINDPTISILGGNTATSFASAFPPETLGQGFFSRLLLIYGEPTGKKITFPESPSSEVVEDTIASLHRIKQICSGPATLTEQARTLLDHIYKNTKPLDDPRFISYSNRRFTHLLKVCLILSAMKYSAEIDSDTVIEANTLLTHTENLMPRALGYFGRARNAEVTHKIISTLKTHGGAMSIRDLWSVLHSDMDRINDLVEQMKNLIFSDSVLVHDGKYMYKSKKKAEVESAVLDYSYLSDEERNLHY